MPAAAGQAESDAGATARMAAWEIFCYLALGTLFGVTLAKGEIISWFRIQEMFRFQSFHMYGIIGSALLVAAVGVGLLRGLRAHTVRGEDIAVPGKALSRWGTRYWAGGTVFGLGWALTGACPGPLFALLGSGVSVIAVAIAAAVGGTWVYGYLRPRLPH